MDLQVVAVGVVEDGVRSGLVGGRFTGEPYAQRLQPLVLSGDVLDAEDDGRRARAVQALLVGLPDGVVAGSSNSPAPPGSSGDLTMYRDAFGTASSSSNPRISV